MYFVEADEGELCIFENRGLPCEEPAVSVLQTVEYRMPLCGWHHNLIVEWNKKRREQ